MIPLVLAALLVSAGVAIYEFSPKARGWVDDHLHRAAAAHQAADSHLGAAQQASAAHQDASAAAAAHQQDAIDAIATQPRTQLSDQRAAAIADIYGAASGAVSTAAGWLTTAFQHLADAAAANREAAASTATAAQGAKTSDQKQAAADSAAAVLDRQRKIDAALAALGVGQCDVRPYPGATPSAINALLLKLHSEGMTVTGNNPWDIDTHNHDVKLRAVWDPRTQVLKIIVTSGKGGYWGLVTCSKIWDEIDPVVRKVMSA